MSLENTYRKIGELVNQKCVDQFALQGHKMTGAFEESLELLTDDKGVSCIGNTYGIYVNVGVKPSEIKHPLTGCIVDFRRCKQVPQICQVCFRFAPANQLYFMPTFGRIVLIDQATHRS